MQTISTFDKYPLWIVFISNLLSFVIYASGFFILLQVSIFLSFGYLLFALFIDFRVIKNHCVDCFYWGKTCGFGKGKISALFFKQGNSERFCKVQMTWKSMIPDMLVSFVPVIAGIVLLISDFKLSILLTTIFILLLSSAGNGFVRGTLTCKYCRQRELGCPAEKLFNKN